MLFYCNPDLSITNTCHIGLNKIGGVGFGWIDDSISSYRKWGTIGLMYPVTYANYDCVRHRYRGATGELSQGWVNALCSAGRNCYFCSKQGIAIFDVMIIRFERCKSILLNHGCCRSFVPRVC